MTPTEAHDVADRIDAIWPNSKIAHDEWIRQLVPNAAGLDAVTEPERMHRALDNLARRQGWAPSIAEVLGQYHNLARPDPTPLRQPLVKPPVGYYGHLATLVNRVAAGDDTFATLELENLTRAWYRNPDRITARLSTRSLDGDDDARTILSWFVCRQLELAEAAKPTPAADVTKAEPADESNAA